MTRATTSLLTLLLLFGACEDVPDNQWVPYPPTYDEPDGRDASPAESGRTLAEVHAVGRSLRSTISYENDPRGISESCEVGVICQTGVFWLNPDGTYVWWSMVGQTGNMYAEIDHECDRGVWRESAGELRLSSCSGASFQSDWSVEDGRLVVGPYRFTPGTTTPGDGCRTQCDPFFDQWRH